MATRDITPSDAKAAEVAGVEEPGFLGEKALHIVESVMAHGIDGVKWFRSAESVARKALAESAGDREAAIALVVRRHLVAGGAEGFLTSLGGLFTLPVALPVNLVAFYALSARMSAAIAHLRGYDLADPRVRSAVVLSLSGADADELLGRAGFRVPMASVSGLAVAQLPAPAAMIVRKAVGFRILAGLGKNTLTRLGRAAPILGGFIGGSLDTWMIRQVAESAREDFPALAGEDISVARADA